LTNRETGVEDAFPLFCKLLEACEWDVEKARKGVIYVDAVERPDVQEALLRLWTKGSIDLRGAALLDLRNVLFVCGCNLTGLDECLGRLGRHPEQPITSEVLRAFGMMPEFVERMGAIARVPPLDESTLVRIMSSVDFSRVKEIDS
jgi:ATP-dependent Clp protease ATP-binding subunit ClpX